MSRSYVGQLYEVGYVGDDGVVYAQPVQRVALSVDSTGLCTSPNRGAAKEGRDYYLQGAAQWFECVEVVYSRARPEGREWYHAISGGQVAFVPRSQGAPWAILDVPNAVRCDMDGDFICGG